MRRSVLVLMVLALAGSLAAFAKEPPRVRLAPGAAAIDLGRPWTATLGVSSTKVRPRLTLRLGRERVTASLRRVRPGLFRARAVLRTIGRWTVSVQIGDRAFAPGSVTVRPALTGAADVVVAPDGTLLVADLGGYVFQAPSGGPVRPVARLSFAVEVAVDPRGGFGVVSAERLVSRVSPGGQVRTLARLDQPTALAFDQAGNAFVSELGGRIRRIDAASGAVTTVAGTGSEGFSGDGGPAVAARLHQPHGLVVDRDGSIVFCDTLNNRLRRIDPEGSISTLATGFLAPGDVTAAPGGVYYVADYGSNRIARVSPTGVVTTTAHADGPNSVAVGSDGSLFVTERVFPRVRHIDPATGAVTTVLGR